MSRKEKTVKKKSKNQWKAWLYLTPMLILLLVFTAWPIFNTIRIAFLCRWDPEVGAIVGYDYQKAMLPEIHYQFGINNFITVFTTGDSFLTALGNTMLLTVLTVPISTMLALLIAVALNSIKFLKKFFQTVFFLPYVTNAIAIPFDKGFGWGGDLNLEYIFEKLFCEPSGQGYPRERAVPEQRNKKILDGVRAAAFRPLEDILSDLDPELLRGAFAGEHFKEYFCADSRPCALKDYILGRVLD